MKMASTLAFLALATVLSATAARAQANAGAQAAQASVPFVMTQVASFNQPWRIAFLPDGRMLITERVGPVWLVTQDGHKTPVANVPAVLIGEAAATRLPLKYIRWAAAASFAAIGVWILIAS